LHFLVRHRLRFPRFKLRHQVYIRYRLPQPGFSSYPNSFSINSHSICSSNTHILFLERRRPIRAQNSQILLFRPIFGTHQPRLQPIFIFYLFLCLFCTKPHVSSFNIRKVSLIFGSSQFKRRHSLWFSQFLYRASFKTCSRLDCIILIWYNGNIIYIWQFM
jgi:hypothetical protein